MKRIKYKPTPEFLLAFGVGAVVTTWTGYVFWLTGQKGAGWALAMSIALFGFLIGFEVARRMWEPIADDALRLGGEIGDLNAKLIAELNRRVEEDLRRAMGKKENNQ